MSRFALDLDMSRCMACGACAIACMDQNDIDVVHGEKPFRNIFDMEKKDNKSGAYRSSFLSLACMHCEDAPCIKACPSRCLSKDPQTNMTIFDTTNCIGCHSCAMACPYGIPSFGSTGKMQKCDGCYVRLHYGLQPACVKVCPAGALKLIDLDGPEQIAKENSLRESSKKMLSRQV